MAEQNTAPLAISMGEPAGIGPDLILALFAGRGRLGLPSFAVYGHAGFLAARAKRLGLDIKIKTCTAGEASKVFAQALPVIDIPGNVKDVPGYPVPASAPVVLEAIARATGDALTGSVRALVTAPIHKGALYTAGFPHPGHTEYLAALCAAGGTPPAPVMMLCDADLRVVPVSVHVPLAKVPEMISTALIVRTGRIVARDLETRFGIARPKLGVAGLNPHAGEDGGIGLEDREAIAPAVALLNRDGIAAEGPFPADSLFVPDRWRQFDTVLAMYHDQALIPIKTLAFDRAVNVTLGLPIVRTSPDHGTASDLAGTGKGSTRSMLAAIHLADRMSQVSQLVPA